MAGDKKRGFDLPRMKFNNPALQSAYEDWFINSAPSAPVEVEYYDPTETKSGTVRRSPINTRMDPYEIARGEMMEKYMKRTGGGVIPFAPVAKRPISSRGTAAAEALTGGKGGKGSSSVNRVGDSAELIAGRDRTNERIKALGGDPVGQRKKGESLWGRVSDVLMRGNYMVAEGINRADKAARGGTNPLEQIEEFGKGAIQGVTGKKKTTFGQLLHKKNVGKNIESWYNENVGGIAGKKTARILGAVAEGGGGLGLDIGLDPSTYLGFGAIPKIGKAAGLVEKAGKHLDEGANIISRGRKTPYTFDEIERELLTGARHVKGKVRHSEEGLIVKPLRQMRNSIAKTRQAEIRAELRTTDEWANIFDRGGIRNANSLAAANKRLNATAREMAEKEADDWMFASIKHYQDVINTNIQKGLGIGLAGTGGKKVTIVPAPVLSAIGTKIHDIDVVNRGLKTFQKYMQASAGISSDLHNLRLQATNSGMTRAEFIGNRLRQTFAGVHRDIRENTWEQSLNGVTNSGERILVDGVEKDMAEFLVEERAHLDSFITGTATGNTPMGPKEMNPMLPSNFRGKFKGKNGVVDITETLKSWDIKDGPQALWLAQQAYERANSLRGMYTSAADSFGFRVSGPGAMKNIGPIVDNFKKKGWREVNEKKTHGLLKGVLFDPETAKGMEKMIDLMTNERNWNTWLRKLARITGPIKFALTVPNPGYHIRNSIGDAFINEIDNVSVNSYMQSAQVLRRATEKYGGTTPLIMEEGNLLEKAFARPSQTVLFHTKKPHKKPGGTRSTAVTEAEIFAGMNQYGITQNFTLSEFGNMVENPNFKLGGKIKSWMVNKSELRENYFRLAHFIELVKRNPSGALTLDENMAYAAARIRKTHFDYTDFTKWEKQVASNVIPFYKWTRKAVPLMVEIMFTNPGKAIMPTKAQYNLSLMSGNDPWTEDPFPNLEGMLPQWMIDAGYSPGNPASALNALPGIEGVSGPGMFAVPNPFTDVFTQTIQPAVEGVKQGPPGIANFLLQQSNPAIKMPYELMENKNTFLSRSGNDVPIYREDTKKKDLLNYLVSQVPYARQANRAFGGEKDKRNFGALASQLTGIYNQQLTPSIVKGELYRQEQAAADKWSDLKKQLIKEWEKKGIEPPQTPAEWEDFLEVYAKTKGTSNYQRPKRKSRFETVL